MPEAFAPLTGGRELAKSLAWDPDCRFTASGAGGALDLVAWDEVRAFMAKPFVSFASPESIEDADFGDV